MRYAAILAFLALPAYAQAPSYTPEQLLGDRHVNLDCDEKTKVCKISEEDMRWIISRDRFLNRLLEVAAAQMKNCGIKGI